MLSAAVCAAPRRARSLFVADAHIMATPTASATPNGEAADAHAAELQQVKLRAVKKIKALEERYNTEKTSAAMVCQLLAVELSNLEADASVTATLRAALVQQQQQEIADLRRQVAEQAQEIAELRQARERSRSRRRQRRQHREVED